MAEFLLFLLLLIVIVAIFPKFFEKFGNLVIRRFKKVFLASKPGKEPEKISGESTVLAEEDPGSKVEDHSIYEEEKRDDDPSNG